MIKAIILSLIIGVVYGQFFLEPSHVVNFSYLSDIALVVLMFSVGISVGANKQVFSKIKEHHIKILIIPIGIIVAKSFIITPIFVACCILSHSASASSNTFGDDFETIPLSTLFLRL